MTIGIIYYGIGNINSIANMIRKIGEKPIILSNPDDIFSVDQLILPGVGAFDTAMQKLNDQNWIPSIQIAVNENKKPLLGICLGMQLLGHKSQEGSFPGLGFLPFDVVKFSMEEPLRYKLPHMGWNNVNICQNSPLLSGLDSNRFYFVHNFHVKTEEKSVVIGETEYEYLFPSIVGAGHIFGVQFHPEKSHKFGMLLIKNFITKC